MDKEIEKKLDIMELEIYHREGLYAGIDFSKYVALKGRERVISHDPKINSVSVEEVIRDFERNGSLQERLFTKAFALNSTDTKGYLFGHDSLVVYFATGTYINNYEWDLGLISSHVPGGPGGGGWGLKGTRKLQLARSLGKEPFDWQKWIKGSLAWAGEGYNKSISIGYEKDESFVTILKIAIEQARAKK